MLSLDTKEEVFQYLCIARHAVVLDMDDADFAYGLDFKALKDMTDAELVEEYECSRDVHSDDELYDRMVAEMASHQMLVTPTVSNNPQEGNMTRQEANRLIVKILADQVEKQPDIRFSQLMRNIGVVDEDIIEPKLIWRNEFNLEPLKLLKRIQSKIKKYRL